MFVWSEARVSGEMIEFYLFIIFGCVAENESMTNSRIFGESVLDERWNKKIKNWKIKSERTKIKDKW